jgi:hypothetical protein
MHFHLLELKSAANLAFTLPVSSIVFCVENKPDTVELHLIDSTVVVLTRAEWLRVKQTLVDYQTTACNLTEFLKQIGGA